MEYVIKVLKYNILVSFLPSMKIKYEVCIIKIIYFNIQINFKCLYTTSDMFHNGIDSFKQTNQQ